MIAADSVNNANEQTRLQPGDWKGARHWTLKGYAAAYGMLDQGMQGDTPIWYSHCAPDFRDERDAHEIIPRLTCGWFTGSDANETAVGIVCRLSHGRMIAGYRWTSNDERVYFPQVFTDEEEAASMADEHARVFAESAREDSERFNAMQDAENDAGNARTYAREAWRAYKVARVAWLADSARFDDAMQSAREGMDEALQALRLARTAVQVTAAAYERG